MDIQDLQLWTISFEIALDRLYNMIDSGNSREDIVKLACEISDDITRVYKDVLDNQPSFAHWIDSILDDFITSLTVEGLAYDVAVVMGVSTSVH